MAEEKKSLGIAEFIAGCMGGFAQVIIGQPFDIVKVRLQTQKVGETLYTGAFDCFKKIVKNEGGPLTLWKGSLPPLLGIGAATSIQFGVNENTRVMMRNLTNSKDLSFLQLAACGSIAGIANSVISIPAEHIRIRMQSQGMMANPPYKGSIDCIRKVYGEFGLRGIYKGGVATIWREIFAYSVYFSTYDWCLRKMTGSDKKKPEAYKVVGAGAVAGICFWLACFPFDVMKTKMQTDSFTNPHFKNTLDCVKQTYRTQGIHGFWRGLAPCLLRAVPVNGGTFMTYEATLGFLKKKKGSEDFSLV